MKSRGIGSREISAARMIPSSLPATIADMQIGTGVRQINSRHADKE
jgi:hypothetical protein